MKKGFIFDQNKCVACGACSASCVLENGWAIQPREIYRFNNDALAGLPVVNLSMACNHCETALCLTGCPTGAYTRNDVTGAVIIDELNCIGCLYCQWNCPYDAPKLKSDRKVINKCDLCSSSLTEGRSPACSTGCPTGALQYGDISGYPENEAVNWIPDKKLAPSLRITGETYAEGPSVIPSGRFSEKQVLKNFRKRLFNSDFSLVLFSFLTTISVSIGCSYLVTDNSPGLLVPLLVIIAAGILSVFHLGAPFSAWMALRNIRQSPLSREITAFSFYTLALLSALVTSSPGLIITASIAGLVLLLAIDNVYHFSDSRKVLFLHSGQTFITGLIMISFFSGMFYPFLFIAVIKAASVIFSLIKNEDSPAERIFRFLRLAFLIITCSVIIAGIDYEDIIITSLFVTGEFIDRLMFYYDFRPISVKQLTNSTINNK